jgi:23S rRNA (cytosine1962-C5)-methyltransferase
VDEEVYLGTHQRLDRDTSGAILYSLAEAANPSLAEQFAGRAIEKHYLAAVSGDPPAAGTLLSHALIPDGSRMRVAAPGEPGAKAARSRILSVRRAGARSLIRLAIETGRTHQVRVQLAAIGCPVAGDLLYGGAPALRLLLHAESLGLEHPTERRRLEVQSSPPFELDDWLEHGWRSALEHPQLLERALELARWKRADLLCAHAAGETTAYRLVNDAADGVPGFSAEVFDRQLVLRTDADAVPSEAAAPELAAPERRLIEQLFPLGFEGVYLKRHPKQASRLVDLTDANVASRTPVRGSAAPNPLIVHEAGVPFEVQLGEGLRTGIFLDQRDNRQRLRQLASGKRVLNLFGYTGSLSVAALLGGATSVTTVDLSRAALSWAERNVARIGRSERHEVIADDAFVALRRLAQRGRQFDVIIVDPPSFSTSKRGRFRAAQDYDQLCELSLRVLADAGMLLACINHRGVSRNALRRFVHTAARSAGFEPPSLRDLPTGIDFPAEYGCEPEMKSVLAEFGSRCGLRSHSANVPEIRKPRAQTARKKTRR